MGDRAASESVIHEDAADSDIDAGTEAGVSTAAGSASDEAGTVSGHEGGGSTAPTDRKAEAGTDHRTGARNEEALHGEAVAGASEPVEIKMSDGSSIQIIQKVSGVEVKVNPSSALLEKYQQNLSAEDWFKDGVNPRSNVPGTRLNSFETIAPGRLARMELYVDALQDKQVSDNSVLQKGMKNILATNIRNFTTFSGYKKPDELFADDVLKQAGLK